ncbi:type II toxin-antitoxin system RelE/ParE family toxin [Burkholderia sp. MSMB1589WGS]|uniref:type II toxin-antitoxin system RelE/ParE family toxin n=1 Tax=Burkholderia sp. MSMB1589WGS TaxID=1636425 RepID=UPI0007B908CE|nr:type II toxin-antitoxin system RelE/ParE family toxin [Burkholderia sp. MSMB1589WGS]
MSTLIWHPDALEDVARLYDFLATNSPAAARRAAQIIVDAADLIAENPGIGAPRAEFREWMARFGRSSYVIRYAVLDAGDVLVTRVWHSREHR